MTDTENTAGPATGPQLKTEAASDMRHVRLSDFWHHAPRLWFAQTEACFASRGVTSEVIKYCLVVGALLPKACAVLPIWCRIRRRWILRTPSSRGC
jgi:hypothetical protein